MTNDVELTVIVFRKCVGVDDIKLAQPEELIAAEYVLPLAFENLHARLFMPSFFFHMSEYIGVCLDDDMERGRFRNGLKHGVNLDKCQTRSRRTDMPTNDTQTESDIKDLESSFQLWVTRAKLVNCFAH